jgi:hypothetical protein
MNMKALFHEICSSISIYAQKMHKFEKIFGNKRGASLKVVKVGNFSEQV